jgi:hypothetical protein
MMPDLEFVKALPSQVPSELMVYSTERARASQSAVLDVFRKLKLPEIQYRPEVMPRRTRTGNNIRPAIRPEFRYVDNWTIAKSGVYTVAVNRLCGSMRFRDEVRHGRQIDAPFRIAKRRLEDISREFLDKSKLLKTPVRDVKIGRITHLRAQGASTSGEVTSEQILDAGVIFARKIDDVAVVGPGGYVMVNIAGDESVLATVKIWRHRAEKLGMAGVLKPDYAIGELQKRLKSHKLIEKAKVLKADFCYFEAGDNKSQRYLEPAYAFVIETKVGNFLHKLTEVIPATRQPKQRWAFRKRFPAPSVVRED